MSALFFGHMRYDAKNPHFHNNDRFVLSKGHAAPLLYAAWAEAAGYTLATCGLWVFFRRSLILGSTEALARAGRCRSSRR